MRLIVCFEIATVNAKANGMVTIRIRAARYNSNPSRSKVISRAIIGGFSTAIRAGTPRFAVIQKFSFF